MRASLTISGLNQTIIAPSARYSVFKSNVTDTYLVRPVFSIKRCAANGYIDTHTAISRLIFFFAPLNIAWFVMTIIVNAVKRMFRRRTMSQRGKEFFERPKPKFDSTSTIPIIITKFRISTSIFCRGIGPIFGRSVHTMRTLLIGHHISHQASAGFCLSRSQAVADNDCGFSTITQAFPGNFASTSPGNFAYDQAPKSHSEDVVNLSHTTILTQKTQERARTLSR